MDTGKKEGPEIDSKILEIRNLTHDIITLGGNVSKNSLEIKEKMRSVVSLVGFVISYPNLKIETIKNPLTELSQNIFELIDSHPKQNDSILTYLGLFSSFANNLVDAMVQKKC